MVDVFGTLGPACDNEDILAEMFKAGMTGIRINLSHVMLADCADSIKRIHSAAAACGVKPKILIDMQGPELRIGNLKEPLVLNEGDEAMLIDAKGDDVNVVDAEFVDTRLISTEQTANVIPVDSLIIDHLSMGKELLLDDGKILAKVVEADCKGGASSENRCDRESRYECYSTEAGGGTAAVRILRGGTLSSRKSIAILGETIEMPALTERDRANLKLAANLGITGVMQPFVRNAEDLKELRATLDASDIKIYAKIENMAGVENLISFFPYVDEIIIARGDLGNAMPLWELPKVQKSIAKACRERNMPFMVVTQMLTSMEHSKVPTRAEVSDIYNAVADGATSVMVTGETAVGENPIDVIRYLTNTARIAAES